MNRSDKTISTAGNVDYVGLAILAVIQRAAQLNHVEAQAALIDRQTGPSPCHKVGFADNFSSPIDQETEEIERAAANGNGLTIALEQAFIRNNAEWPEN